MLHGIPSSWERFSSRGDAPIPRYLGFTTAVIVVVSVSLLLTNPPAVSRLLLIINFTYPVYKRTKWRVIRFRIRDW